MIGTFITFFLQMLTAIWYNIQNYWIISFNGTDTYSIVYVIYWSLLISVVLILFIRLMGGAFHEIKESWRSTMK